MPKHEPQTLKAHTRRTLLASAMALGATAALAQDKAPEQTPEPTVGKKGGSMLGPRNPECRRQRPHRRCSKLCGLD